jgi:histidine triad (HIT) family protein
MESCIFCKIVAGTLPSNPIHSDERCLVVMDINPATRGHCLVLPKAHHQDLYELPADVWSHIAAVSQRVAIAARNALACEGVNLFQATGRAAFQTIFHFHLHVLPRWRGDGLVAPWTLRPGDPEQIRAAGDALRAALD